MGTTPGGLPYPEPTDPVAAGADAIKALATKTESRYQAGGNTVTVTATGGLTPVITFPVPYTVAPQVVACLFLGSGGSDYTGYLQSITPTGFTFRVMKAGTVAPSGDVVRVNWVAIGVPT